MLHAKLFASASKIIASRTVSTGCSSFTRRARFAGPPRRCAGFASVTGRSASDGSRTSCARNWIRKGGMNYDHEFKEA